MRVNKTALGAKFAPKVRSQYECQKKYPLLTCAHLGLLPQTALLGRRRHSFGSRRIRDSYQ